MLHLVSPWKDYWTGWSLGSLKPELFEVNDYTRLQSDTMLCKKATKWTKMSETYTNRGQRGVTCLNLFRICNDHREGEKMNTVTGCKITTIQKGDPKGSQTGLFRWWLLWRAFCMFVPRGLLSYNPLMCVPFHSLLFHCIYTNHYASVISRNSLTFWLPTK